MSMWTYKCVHSGERDKVCERSFERALNINTFLCLVDLKKKVYVQVQSVCAESTKKGVNQRWKDPRQTQQRQESSTVTLAYPTRLRSLLLSLSEVLKASVPVSVEELELLKLLEI